jgi:hypothetical protein
MGILARQFDNIVPIRRQCFCRMRRVDADRRQNPFIRCGQFTAAAAGRELGADGENGRYTRGLARTNTPGKSAARCSDARWAWVSRVHTRQHI